MNRDCVYIYNNLIKLTRDKSLYLNLNDSETFSDRLIFLLLHLSFFLKVFKDQKTREYHQDLHDYIFKQIEISIREIGYGDVSINKNMKIYINFFYDILSKIDAWDTIDFTKKSTILSNYINKPKNISFYVKYFDKLCTFYKNNTLIFFTKDIEELKF
tara:strand:+ start:315 stop:788 length:474 start_codon:yes stop_codon:yes gene_type:complete